jgi:hypothetical protein
MSPKQALQRFERIGQAYLLFGQTEPALFHLIFGKGNEGFRKALISGNGRSPTFA